MARNRIIPIFVPHIGCPHHCVFCNQRRISGRQRAVTASEVRAIVEEALPKAGAGAEVAFYGGSFSAVDPAYQQELLGAVAPFLRNGAISSIRISTRPDAIDPETLDRLRRSGVKTVELGCQSMEDTVLRRSERGHTRAQVLEAAAQLKAFDMRMILQMMTGLPGDVDETALATAHALADLKPDGVRIYPTVVVRDTTLYDDFCRGGYHAQSVEEATELCARILRIFIDRSIPVLRIGLQPTDELTGGGAVAGAYHPALGELVKSRVYRNTAERLLEPHRGTETVTLGVAPNRISLMVGQKRCNLAWLRDTFGISRVKVEGAGVKDWEIILQS